MTDKKAQALVEGVDYLLTGETYEFQHPKSDKWVRNSGVVQVYLAATNAITWKCVKCDYVNDNARAVFGHRASHTKRDTEHQHQLLLEQKAAAFDLLPPQMQQVLLERLKTEKKEHRNANSGGATEEGR